MTEVDTSMYNKNPLKPLNPLEMVSGYASAAHTINENKLQQQQIRGRQALGQIVSQSMNEDGSPNPAKILQKASKNPDAAWMVLQLQEEAKNANPLTSYLGTNEQGQPTPAQAPYYQVAGQNNPNWQVGENKLTTGAPPENNAPPQSGNALMPPGAGAQQQQQAPAMDPSQVDALAAHTDAMLNVVEPLANDPNLDNKKIIRGVSDLVAHPDAKFSAMDGASALSKIPSGPNGQPANPQQLQQKIQPIYQQLKQNQAAIAQMRQAMNPQQPNPTKMSTPGVATGLPAGFSENLQQAQQHYGQVMQQADSVPVENAALDNVYDLSKSGAPSGTVLGEFYSYLAAHNIAPEGAQTDAEKLALIKSHASQLALAAGMPGSDARLDALQSAKVDDANLPKVIQTMIPYLKAVNNSKVAQAKFYRQQDPSGANANQITNARTTWQQNLDPRVFELQELQHDPEELKKFVSGLSKADRLKLSEKRKMALQLGILE